MTILTKGEFNHIKSDLGAHLELLVTVAMDQLMTQVCVHLSYQMCITQVHTHILTDPNNGREQLEAIDLRDETVRKTWLSKRA